MKKGAMLALMALSGGAVFFLSGLPMFGYDPAVMTAPGDGMFSTAEILRIVYTILGVAAPVIVQKYFPKFLPILMQLLELFNIKEKAVSSKTGVNGLSGAQKSLCEIGQYAVATGNSDLIKDLGKNFEKVHLIAIDEMNEKAVEEIEAAKEKMVKAITGGK